MPSRKAPSLSPALKALCMHHELPACYLEAGERPILANPAFEAQAERLLGVPWPAIAGQDHAPLAARARPAQAHKQPAFDRGGWVTPTGERWDLHALPFLEESGRCLGVVLYFQPPPPPDERGRLAEAAIANAAEALLLVEGDRVTPQNEAAVRLFACPDAGGQLPIEAFRRPFSIATEAGDPVPAEQDPFEAAAAGRSLGTTTFRLDGPEGERFVQVRVTPLLSIEQGETAALVTAVDLTEALGDRRRLLAATARAQAILAHISDGVLVVSAAGKVCEANPAARRLLRLPPDSDLSTLERLDIRDLEDRRIPPDRMPISRVLAGEHVSRVYLKVIENGSPRVLAVRGTPMPDEKGEPSLGVVVLHDVSEPHRLRQALKEKVTELEAAMATMCEIDRLKTDFLNTMSHELRTPLSAIMGYVEFLEEGVAGELTDQQQEFLAHVGTSAHQLLAMIDNLLDFARLEAGRLHLVPSPIDLCVLIHELLPRFEERATAKGIRLAIEREPGLSPVMADHTRLIQVLTNLLDNALKFTPEGGTVTLSCATAGPDRVEVAVADTGIGIPPEAMNRMFSKFFQVESGLRRETGGTGLGLAISKLLVEAQGGRIGLESHLGTGTRVWVSLPVWKEG